MRLTSIPFLFATVLFASTFLTSCAYEKSAAYDYDNNTNGAFEVQADALYANANGTYDKEERKNYSDLNSKTSYSGPKMLVYNANIGITVKNSDSTISQITRIASEQKGYVVSKSNYQITIRIESEKLDGTVAQVSKLGKLTRKSVSSKHIPKNDEMRIYAEATKNPYTHARIEIGLVMGLRPGEILGLKWSDIDWSLKTMTIERQVQRVKGKGLVFQTVKTGKTRTLHLSETQIEILTIHRYDQDSKKGSWTQDEDLLFPNSEGKKKDSKADHKAWKALLKASGVKSDYTRYQMRKTAFTNLSANGVDVRTIMEMSGHSQASTLLTSYVHATSESIKNALDIQDRNRPTAERMQSIELDREVEEWIARANLIDQQTQIDSPQG